MTAATNRLRKLESAATPGPWKHGPLKWEVWARNAAGEMTVRTAATHRKGGRKVEADAALIAEARTALPALLAIAEAAAFYADYVEPFATQGTGPSLKAALAALEALVIPNRPLLRAGQRAGIDALAQPG